MNAPKGAQRSAIIGERPGDAHWSEYMRRLAPRVLSYIRRLPCSAEEAQGILADVWAETVLEGIDLPNAKSPWHALLPILRRECLQHVRQWRREVALEARALASELPIQEDGDAHLSNDSFNQVISRLAALPRKQRQAIKLRFMQSKSYDEIAAVLRTSTGSARASVCIGLARIRNSFR